MTATSAGFRLAVLLSCSCSVSIAHAETIVFTSWGGTTQAAQNKDWADAFAKQNGVTVAKDGPTDYGKLKAMIESGNVSWDVVDVESDFAARAEKDGLLEPLDLPKVQAADIDPRFLSADAVGSFYYAFVLGYGNAAGKHPQHWNDLFDLKTFPGKRAFYKWAAPGLLEIALLADGVPADKLYPLDLERAFRKLDTIKDSVVWWSSGAQSLASGEVATGVFWNGRLTALQNTGVDVGIGWDQNVSAADMLVIPKGSRHVEAARRFIAFATGVEPQARFAADTGYAPINTKSEAVLSPTDRKTLPNQHEEGHIDPDIAYWANHRDEIAKQWYAWQTR